MSAAERRPVPALKDSAGWHIFCLGYMEDEEDEEAVESGLCLLLLMLLFLTLARIVIIEIANPKI